MEEIYIGSITLTKDILKVMMNKEKVAFMELGFSTYAIMFSGGILHFVYLQDDHPKDNKPYFLSFYTKELKEVKEREVKLYNDEYEFYA